MPLKMLAFKANNINVFNQTKTRIELDQSSKGSFSLHLTPTPIFILRGQFRPVKRILSNKVQLQ